MTKRSEPSPVQWLVSVASTVQLASGERDEGDEDKGMVGLRCRYAPHRPTAGCGGKMERSPFELIDCPGREARRRQLAFAQ